LVVTLNEAINGAGGYYAHRFEKVPDPKPVRRDPVFAPGDRVQYFGGAGFYQTKHVGRTATVTHGTDKAGCVTVKWDDNGALCGVYAENLRKINGKRPSMGWIDEGLSKHKDAVKATIPGENGPEALVPDVVALPPHYRNHPSGVECITITQHMNFCRGNAIKYVWRAGEKGGPDKEIEDLRKARQYLDIEIKRLESAKND
jgi:hypothetical protein